MALWDWLDKVFGFDPASKDGGVVLAEIQRKNAEELIRMWPDPPQHLRGDYGLYQQLIDYKPKGKPLADKESKRPVLHLDDYQPRDPEFPASRMVFERSFPQPPKMTIEELQKRHAGFMTRQDPRDWVHYRNRHPGIRDSAVGSLPPMRDAMADLTALLAEFHQHLHERDLVAVEVAVQHEVAEQVGLEPQGWHYRVEALVVPRAALYAEQAQFEQTQEAIEAQKARLSAEIAERNATRNTARGA